MDQYFVDGEAEEVKTLKKLGINEERKRSDRSEAVKALS